MGKVLGWNEVKRAVDSAKAEGKKIVFTNGCFDIIHLGHVRYLREAKRLGDAVEGALAQAQGYAAALGVVCDLIVTDGLRYRLFEYDGRADFLPTAYANLTRLKQSAEKLFARMRRA